MDEIIVNGKPLPIIFGIRVIQKLSEKHNKTLGETLSDDLSQSVDLIADVSAIALNEGARRSGSDKRYTPDDVIDMMEDRLSLFGELATKLSQAMNASVESIKSMGKPTGQTSPKNRNRHRNRTHRK